MSLAHIDLNLLVALDALLRERSVSRAGIDLGLSQPAMSKALQRLRALFADELLVRAGHEYYLTPVAEDLIAPVEDILHRIAATVERRPDFDPAHDHHVFRIAAHDAAEYLLIRPMIRRIAEVAPRISLRVQPLSGQNTIEAIEAGDLDIGLWSYEYFESYLSRAVLYRDRFVLAVSADRTDISDRISEEKFGTMPRANYYWSHVHRSGDRLLPDWLTSEAEPTRIATVSHVMRLLQLRGTDVIAVTYEKLAESLREIAGVRVVEPPFQSPAVVEGMVWHPRNTEDSAHRWLREQFLDIASGL